MSRPATRILPLARARRWLALGSLVCGLGAIPLEAQTLFLTTEYVNTWFTGGAVEYQSLSADGGIAEFEANYPNTAYPDLKDAYPEGTSFFQGHVASLGDIDGLVAYYRFDESSGDAAPDRMGRIPGTLTGFSDPDAAWVTSSDALGNWLQFDGNDDYVDLGNPEILQITGDLTIEAWIRTDSFSNRQTVVTKAYGGEYEITIERNGSLAFYHGTTGENAGSNNSTYEKFQTADGAIGETGRWYHIAVVRDLSTDPGTVRLYVDGVELLDDTTIFSSLTASILSVGIGQPRGGTSHFDGEIDDVRFWNVARTADEIAHNRDTPVAEPATPSNDGLAADGAPVFGLASSSFGQAIAGLQATHQMGEIIDPPSNAKPGATPVIEPDYAAVWLEYNDTVYAANPGALTIDWTVETEPGVFGTEQETYLISGATVKDPVTIFWTEGQNVGPRVDLGSIPYIRIHHNAMIPEQTELVDDGSGGVVEEVVDITTEGLWLNESDQLQADGYEGLVLLEYASSEDGPLIDFEIVRVKKPAFQEIDVPIGSRLLPDPNNNQWGADGENPKVIRGLGNPSDEESVFLYQHAIAGPMRNHVFAIRRTDRPEQAEVAWLRRAVNDVLWPYEIDRYNMEWPTPEDVTPEGDTYEEAGLLQTYVRGTEVDEEGPSVEIDSAIFAELMDFQEPVDHATLATSEFSTSLLDESGARFASADPGDPLYFATDIDLNGSGYSLLKYEEDDQVWFTVVRSVFRDDDVVFELDAVAADIGTELVQESGLPGYVHTRSAADLDDVYNINTYAFPETDSAIFGVNQGSLEVWWLSSQQQADQPTPVYWPATVENFALDWPAGAPEVILASNDGTGSLDDLSGTTLYRQEDPSLPGYNPNEEHAIKISGTFYALRTDLNSSEHSLPYILIEYTDANGDPAMLVYAVEDSTDSVPFEYPIKAGTLIQAVSPILSLTPAEQSFEFVGSNAAAWQDKNDYWWAMRAGPDGFDSDGNAVDGDGDGVSSNTTATITMRFYYPVQDTFDFPGQDTPPEPGEEIPYLSGGDLEALPGEVIYTVYWPDDPALDAIDGIARDAEPKKLLIGETLVTTKNLLPDIANQKSVTILYQQSHYAMEPGDSVTLIDPTRERTVYLPDLRAEGESGIPDDIETDTADGFTFFPTLPPHLRNRFFYDLAADELVLQGEVVESTAGVEPYYVLLNVLEGSEDDNDSDIARIKALSEDAVWSDYIDAMATTVETFDEEGEVDESLTEDFPATELITIDNDQTPFDSLALSAGVGGGTGYVSLAFNNSVTFASSSDPISIEIIKVADPLYDGEIKGIPSDNPLDELYTLRHSGDFAAETAEYEFEWLYAFPNDDGVAPDTEDEDGNIVVEDNYLDYAFGTALNTITIEGPGLITLSDTHFVMRYRPASPDNPLYVEADGENVSEWSAWTDPQLVPGWIKRALDGLAPFEQRIDSFRDNSVNTIVSILSQAGTRWEGNIAFNLDEVDKFGLIEIYETILNRGKDLSVDAGYNEPTANDALLLAAGRLSDLYMVLGNEAYADAADPTIAISSTDEIYGAEATTLFPFMNQLPSLLDEELALLRGRDDSFAPSIDTKPFYNRLIWNYTQSFTGGELAYALNYNIKDDTGNIDGTIDEDDAAQFYPQGHGDAWGHYLSAIKNYYNLLQNDNFTWEPRIESVLVGGVTVNVDFLDERKFALAAAARAQTGLQIAQLTRRQNYAEDPFETLDSYTDENAERAWGTGDWSSRAGQAAYYDWVVGNALLPDIDEDPDHSGIQVIDRTTVTELAEVSSTLTSMQQVADEADMGLNPLGMSRDVVPFDIDFQRFKWFRTSHFQQAYEKALAALNNVKRAFDYTQGLAQELRAQADDANVFQTLVEDQEIGFNSRLIEIYGYPYADDIGPGKTYESDYNGPDLIHYNYVDFEDIVGQDSNAQTFTLDIYESEVDPSDGSLTQGEAQTVEFSISEPGFATKPNTWTGERRAQGLLQMAVTRVIRSYFDVLRANEAHTNILFEITQKSDLIGSRVDANDEAGELLLVRKQEKITLKAAAALFNLLARNNAFRAEIVEAIADANEEALPKVAGFGFSTVLDPTSGPRAAIKAGSVVPQAGFLAASSAFEFIAENFEQAIELTGDDFDISLADVEDAYLIESMVAELENALARQSLARLEVESAIADLEAAEEEYLSLLAEGVRLQDSLETFRTKTAAGIQEFRQKDLGYRLFRDEALDKYQSLFDLAARYVYLAAKVYDYETALLASDEANTPGAEFLADVVRARSIGQVIDGIPQLGTGLADIMARMKDNWDVLEGRLGFNNPDSETTSFSLRSELFRILPDDDGDESWRTQLDEHWVDNIFDVPGFAQYARPFSPAEESEPGLVIEFPSTIEFARNFFGWDLAGGDNAYDSSHFATKLKSAGVYFVGYNNEFNTDTSSGGGLANQPRVYLIPAGEDIMLTPTSETGAVRTWKVVDQAIPLPRNIGGTEFEDPDFIGALDSLTDEFGAIRKYASFRAYHDSDHTEDEALATSRLIGRSVWNTNWLLVIPAGTLLSDRDEAKARFIEGATDDSGVRDLNGVQDIRVIFETYSYSGN